MQYVQYEFFTRDEIERDWLISLLTDLKFEGFEETDDSLRAYIPAPDAENLHIKDLLYDNDFFHILFERKEMEDKNWNEEWEKNFEPVVIGKQVGIRAPFHTELKTKYELVIEPKMSFGTGHHATTALMVELMLQFPPAFKTVLDFGSGTGVLAILAEKLNATKIVAIDNEEWAFHNCQENTERNNCVKVKCLHGDDTVAFQEKFDVILANINRNVILRNLKTWVGYLNNGGVMMVSGLLLSDEKDIIVEAAKCGLQMKEVKRENGWIAIAFEVARRNWIMA